MRTVASMDLGKLALGCPGSGSPACQLAKLAYKESSGKLSLMRQPGLVFASAAKLATLAIDGGWQARRPNFCRCKSYHRPERKAV